MVMSLEEYNKQKGVNAKDIERYKELHMLITTHYSEYYYQEIKTILDDFAWYISTFKDNRDTRFFDRLKKELAEDMHFMRGALTAYSRTIKFAKKMKRIAKFLHGFDSKELKSIPEDLNEYDKSLYNDYTKQIGADGLLPSSENIFRFVGEKILKTHL